MYSTNMRQLKTNLLNHLLWPQMTSALWQTDVEIRHKWRRYPSNYFKRPVAYPNKGHNKLLLESITI